WQMCSSHSPRDSGYTQPPPHSLTHSHTQTHTHTHSVSRAGQWDVLQKPPSHQTALALSVGGSAGPGDPLQHTGPWRGYRSAAVHRGSRAAPGESLDKWALKRPINR